MTADQPDVRHCTNDWRSSSLTVQYCNTLIERHWCTGQFNQRGSVFHQDGTGGFDAARFLTKTGQVTTYAARFFTKAPLRG